MSGAQDGAAVLGQKELLIGTSRFLPQVAFVAYKVVLSGYYIFWAVYWPEAEGFSKQAVHQLTFWTWDACAGYFVVSTATAFLCWRATGYRHDSATEPEPSSPTGVASVSHVDTGTQQRGEIRIDGPAAPIHGSFETLSYTPREQRPPGQKGAEAAARAAAIPTAAQGSRLVQSCDFSRPVPWTLRWLQLILWNIACVASLLVTLVWASEDVSALLQQTLRYLEQVRDGVKNFDVQAHGSIAFFMLVDQVIIADEFKLKHVIISQIYGFVYLAFSVFWFYTAPEGEKYLYEDFLDWEKNRVNACVAGATAIGIIAPLAASVHFSIYRMREALNKRNDAIRARAKRWSIQTQGSFRC